VGGLIDLGTLNVTRKADMHLIYEAALKTAIEDATAQIAKDVANPEWVEGKLIADAGANALTAAKRGVDFFQHENFWRAYWYLKRSAAFDPSNQAALTYYAACLARLGQYTEAGVEFQNAIRIDPSSPDAEQARKWVAQLNR
jgi:Flp pilus assembly protein TadD